MIQPQKKQKTLFLVRHGKSDWSEELTDKQRPILARAHQDIKLVCSEFKKHFSGQLHLISSTAVRATQTANLLKEALGSQVETFILEEQLYTFNHSEVYQYIQQISDHKQNVMLIGHNPAFTSLCGFFTQRLPENLPTSGLVQLDFPELIHWKFAAEAVMKLELFPKNLR